MPYDPNYVILELPAAFLTTFSFFPQIVKAYRTRRAVIIYLTSKTGQWACYTTLFATLPSKHLFSAVFCCV